MIRFTIHGEKVQPAFDEWIANDVAPKLRGFFVKDGSGFWEGKAESAFQLEVLVDLRHNHVTSTDVNRLADAYRRRADQSEVWVTRETGIGINIVRRPAYIPPREESLCDTVTPSVAVG